MKLLSLLPFCLALSLRTNYRSVQGDAQTVNLAVNCLGQNEVIDKCYQQIQDAAEVCLSAENVEWGNCLVILTVKTSTNTKSLTIDSSREGFMRRLVNIAGSCKQASQRCFSLVEFSKNLCGTLENANLVPECQSIVASEPTVVRNTNPFEENYEPPEGLSDKSNQQVTDTAVPVKYDAELDKAVSSVGDAKEPTEQVIDERLSNNMEMREIIDCLQHKWRSSCQPLIEAAAMKCLKDSTADRFFCVPIIQLVVGHIGTYFEYPSYQEAEISRQKFTHEAITYFIDECKDSATWKCLELGELTRRRCDDLGSSDAWFLSHVSLKDERENCKNIPVSKNDEKHPGWLQQLSDETTARNWKDLSKCKDSLNYDVGEFKKDYVEECIQLSWKLLVSPEIMKDVMRTIEITETLAAFIAGLKGLLKIDKCSTDCKEVYYDYISFFKTTTGITDLSQPLESIPDYSGWLKDVQDIQNKYKALTAFAYTEDLEIPTECAVPTEKAVIQRCVKLLEKDERFSEKVAKLKLRLSQWWDNKKADSSEISRRMKGILKPNKTHRFQ